jgi:hypothetical protein
MEDSAMQLVWATIALIPLVASGLVHTKAVTVNKAKAGYVCPITGETLPCPKCCPLNQKK